MGGKNDDRRDRRRGLAVWAGLTGLAIAIGGFMARFFQRGETRQPAGRGAQTQPPTARPIQRADVGQPERVGTHPVPIEEHPEGHETRDMDFSTVARVGIGFIIAMGLVLVVVTLTQLSFLAQRPVLMPPQVGNAPNVGLPPQPRLLADPPKLLNALHADEDATLNVYGYVDKAGGKLRIPISRAIDQIAQKGLPAASGGTPAPQAPVEGQNVPAQWSSGRTQQELQPKP